MAINCFSDAASQLTGISYTQGATGLGSLTYAYDAAGRQAGVGGTYARTGVPQAVSPGTPPNINNQLTQWNGKTLTYDLNGNLTGDGTNNYAWNARNQLTSISTNGTTVASFQYDAFGRRVSKTIGGTTQFLYDGVNPVQELSGTSAPANLITGGVDEYFQRTDSAGARNFLTDALGGTLALTDSNGAVLTSYTYEPFGNTQVSSSTTNSFAFTGRELDSTGLYFYRGRYYSPSLQRFISEDPIGFRGGINVYAYSENSPISLRDPLGLQGGPENFGSGWTGRVDRWAGGEGGDFEIHVFDSSGNEVGVVGGMDGWIGKHGFEDNVPPEGIPDSVLDQINGLNVAELRAGGILPPKGTADISGGSYLNPGRNIFPVLLWGPGLLSEYLDYRDLTLRGRKNGLTPEQELCRESREAGNPELLISPFFGPLPNPCYVEPGFHFPKLTARNNNEDADRDTGEFEVSGYQIPDSFICLGEWLCERKLPASRSQVGTTFQWGRSYAESV